MLTERSERIRAARKLIRRATREKSGLFLAEGLQAVREALTNQTDGVVEVFAADRASDEIADLAVRGAVPVRLGTAKALASLSETVTPQGVVAVCRSVTVGLDTALGAGPRLLSVMVESRDPGNVGAVIRSSDAAGADAAILTTESADPQGGKAVRASAGSLFHLPVVTGAELSDVVAAARARRMTVVAADGAGDVDLHSAAQILAGRTAWLFGNEAHGLPRQALDLADHVVRVPIYGRAESLNLATAATICLYESARHHH